MSECKPSCDLECVLSQSSAATTIGLLFAVIRVTKPLLFLAKVVVIDGCCDRAFSQYRRLVRLVNCSRCFFCFFFLTVGLLFEKGSRR